ncbi:MAG: hypothetical protein QG646_676, partial [Euryarchaeota archaeon]|nr:hypothetical protein [Euryarchaeota archaeon]
DINQRIPETVIPYRVVPQIAEYKAQDLDFVRLQSQ